MDVLSLLVTLGLVALGLSLIVTVGSILIAVVVFGAQAAIGLARGN